MTKKRSAKYTRRDNNTWQTSVTTGHDESGKAIRKTLYGKTRKALAEKEAALRSQLAAGTYSNKKMTVAHYLDMWMVQKKRAIKESTSESYERSIKKYLLPRLGGVQLHNLTTMQIQIALQEIAETSGARTSNLARTILFGAMKQAVRWNLRPHNPVEGTTRTKETKRDMTLWTLDEATRFLVVASQHRLHALFHVAMSTGLRQGELVGLRWSDIDGNIMSVQRSVRTRSGVPVISTPKTERGKRRVHLSEEDVAVLDEHRIRQGIEEAEAGEAWVNTGHIFVSSIGTLLNGSNLSKTLHGLQETAEVPRTRFHDLRHLHVSLLIKSGEVDPITIAERVGHSDVNFTMHTYGHVFDEQRSGAAIPLSKLLSKAEEKAQ